MKIVKEKNKIYIKIGSINQVATTDRDFYSSVYRLIMVDY